MTKKSLLLLCILLPMLACQAIPTPPALTPTAPGRDTSTPAPLTGSTDSLLTTQPASPLDSPAQPVSTQLAVQDLPEEAFSNTTIPAWQRSETPVALPETPLDIESLANQQVLSGLTSAQLKFFSQNGFIVLQDDLANFGLMRQEISQKYGQPYFLTVDAAANAFQQIMDQTIFALERDVLAPRLMEILLALMADIQGNLPNIPGSIIEKDARQALAYLAVGYRLLDPAAQLDLDAELEQLVYAQVEQVLRAEGRQNLVLIPEIALDFAEFRPPAFYAGEPSLEAYHRSSTWFSRAFFPLNGIQVEAISRAPLIITMAMRKTRLVDRSVFEAWEEFDEAMSFLYGRSQGDDPRRFALLMDQVYGGTISILTLSNETQWRVFRGLAQTLPTPAVYPSLGIHAGGLPGNQGWRLLGVRLPMEQVVLSELVYPQVGTADAPRTLPAGLDMLASLGSDVADELVRSSAATMYNNYLPQLGKMQTAFQTRSQSQWLSALSSSWFYAYLPLVLPEDEAGSSNLKTAAWRFKDLNSAYAAWAGFNHRAKFIPLPPPLANTSETNTTASDSMPASNPAPAYVEPVPEVFYRLSSLAYALMDGLSQRDLIGLAVSNGSQKPVQPWLLALQEIGDQFKQFGDIAARELRGDPLTATDFALIQAPLGVMERQAENRDSDTANRNDFVAALSIPVAASIARGGETELWIATGRLDRILVAVPLNGELVVAQGGIIAAHEFSQPVEEFLPDSEWRWIVDNAQPQSPVWFESWQIPGGTPVNILYFRIGDVYRITTSGANLSVRETPSVGEKAIYRLHPGDYVEIIDGPRFEAGVNWWKVRLIPADRSAVVGWVVESFEWFERVWDQ